jgi:hypothetical protein
VRAKRLRKASIFLSGMSFELWVLEKGAVAAEPMEVGFFGVEGEVAERTNLSHQTSCLWHLHARIYKRLAWRSDLYRSRQGGVGILEC